MDIQKIIAEAQAKADANRDGKLSVEDIDELAQQYGIDPTLVETVKQKVDVDGDGRISIEDIQSSIGDVSTLVSTLKDKFFGSNK